MLFNYVQYLFVKNFFSISRSRTWFTNCYRKCACENVSDHMDHVDHNHPKHEFKNTLISLSAGALAGAIAKTVIAPLDRTKINFQSATVEKAPFSIRAGIKFMRDTVIMEKMTIKNDPKFVNKRLNIALCNIQSFSALWRGNTATLFRISPFAAIQFASHRKWKVFLCVDNHPHHALENQNHNSIYSAKKYIQFIPENIRRFLSGSLAGVTASSMTYPLDLARARMAVTTKDKYSNLFQVFEKIVQKEGWHALYRGFTPTVMGSIPYAGTSFYTYETLKKAEIISDYYENKNKDKLKPTKEGPFLEPHATDVTDIKMLPSPITQKGNSHYTITPFHRLLYGALAGLVGQTSSYPLDVVRRRMQTTPIYFKPGKILPNPVLAQNCPYSGIISTAKYIIKTEGFIKGLYKGLSMNWIKGPIAVGISFSTFDILQKYLQNIFLL